MSEYLPLVILGVLIPCSLYMLVRNNRVYQFQRHLLTILREHCGSDDFDDLHEEFQSVQYFEMIESPLRNLESFYEGTQLLALYRKERGL